MGLQNSRVKLYLSEMDDVVPRSIWNYGDVGHTQQATNEIKELFSGEQVFDTPKPLKLLRRIVQLSSNKNDDIILDFFAGSGTTAHAIEQTRRWHFRKSIIVQLPEVLLESNREQKAATLFV
jgi:adenine-specific DNA-methyltransferase